MASWCPNCGRKTGEDEKFCRQCGMPQDLRGDQAAAWILNTERRVKSAPVPEAPVTRVVNPSPTSPNSGPAFLQQPAFNVPPPAPVVYQAPPARGAQIRLGDWLSGGWRLYTQNWLLMSVACLLALVLGSATFGILAGPLLMGLFRMSFKTMRQERPEMSDLFNWEGRFLPAFLAFLVFFLIHLGISALVGNGPLSMLVTLVVSPFLTLLTGLTMPYILERRPDVAQAINDVSRLVFSRDALMWWIVGLALMGISAAGIVGCGVGIFVTVPWMISSAAVAYRDIYGVDDPNRTNQ